MDKIGNNNHLIDFLKFVLVRDRNLRPDIDSVIKRFDNLYTNLFPNDKEPLHNQPTVNLTSNHNN